MRLVVLVAVIGCAPRAADDPCAAPTLDSPIAITLTPGSAAQWWSSESHPFIVDAPDLAWFECPSAIAHALDRQPDLAITAVGGSATTTIEIDPTTTYQAVLGIGISMEQASVANILRLSPASRLELVTRMFDPVAGLGNNLVRITMGTSDFTDQPWYTYDDGARGFSIDRDVELGIVDVVRQIRTIAPDVKIFAAPWSPPAWMKTTGAIAGGALRSDAIDALAGYFRSFVEAYRAAGIPIYAVTLQNEPRAESTDMPTCLVTAEQEAALVKAVKRELAAAGLDTKVWVYDHNFDAAVDYTGDLFADPDAAAATNGVAFHDYAGDPTAMTAVHDRYPDKDLVVTEKTLWGVAGVDRVAQYFRNWSRSYVSWITMLDRDGEPNRGPNSQKLRRFVRDGDGYYATPEHYLFGLYSRFVAAGARRIASTYGSAATVTDVAFLNPDGTIVVVVANQTDDAQDFALRFGDSQIAATLPAKTAASYVWLTRTAASAAASR